MNAVYLMDHICCEHIKLLLVTSKGIMTSQVTNMFCTVVCALATAARLEIKAPKKATRDVDQQMKVHALQREYCPDTDLLGQ